MFEILEENQIPLPKNPPDTSDLIRDPFMETAAARVIAMSILLDAIYAVERLGFALAVKEDQKTGERGLYLVGGE